MSGQPPAWITIDLGAISSNVARLKEYAAGGEVMAVVKGGAYGHGLVPSARAALRGGATWLGVAQMAEALALRAAGVEAPLLTWLHAPGTDFAPALRQGIDIGVPAVWELDAVVSAARETGTTARVHLKADTGLGRNGAYGADWDDLLVAAGRAQAEGAVEVAGVFTHFACSDLPTHPSVQAQQDLFRERVAQAERARLPLQVRHMSNSAATLLLPEAAWDLVRPGLAVYGLSPAPDHGDPAHFGLRPAMRLEARATVVKRVPAGQGVSYGHTHVTDHESTLVDVPLGYADGVFRHASGVGPVQIGGERFTVAGRVCMDQFVVDVGDLDAHAGDPVVLFGAGDDGEPMAEDWAQAVGTISYEIVTRMSTRLPRVYVGSGAEQSTTETPAEGATT